MLIRRSAIALGLSTLLGCSQLYMDFKSPRLDNLKTRVGFQWTEEKCADSGCAFLIEQGAEPASERALRETYLLRSVERTLAFLQEPAQNERFTYVVVQSPARMKDLIGVSLGPSSAMSFPHTRVICGDPGTWKAAHEVAHMVSILHWGESATWMKEGLAVAVDDQWYDCDLYALAKHLRNKGQLVPLTELMRQFRKLDELVTYPEAGSFVKFLRETYGISTVKEIWKHGASNIPKFVGVSLPELERQWLDRIDKADDRNVNYKVRNEP